MTWGRMRTRPRGYWLACDREGVPNFHLAGLFSLQTLDLELAPQPREVILRPAAVPQNTRNFLGLVINPGVTRAASSIRTRCTRRLNLSGAGSQRGCVSRTARGAWLCMLV